MPLQGKKLLPLCIALGKPDHGDQRRLYKLFGGVQTVVVRLTEADVWSLLGLGRLRVGWINCHICKRVEGAGCFRCHGCDHVSRDCTLSGRKDACWYQDASRKADVLVCSPDLSIGDFLVTDAGYVWVEVAGVRVYSCYFCPNDPFEIFETQILLLDESLREASGRSLIACDFNSKSSVWGKVLLDRRGIMVGEKVWKIAKSTLRQGIKKSRLQCWKDLIGEVEKDPWGLTFKIVTKRLVTKRKATGLDNPDRVKYIVRSLFPHVKLLLRQGQSSCMVRREELLTLEELKRAG